MNKNMDTYEKKYKNALTIAQSRFKIEKDESVLTCLGMMFPELRESEDERIWKAIDEIMKLDKAWEIAGKHGLTAADIRIWVKKQKEPKPVELDEELELGLDRARQIVFAAKGNLEGYESDDGISECDSAIEAIDEILKNGITTKPVEWSEEDERRIDAICELLENTSAIHPNYSHRKLIIWLKSLRPVKQEWSKKDEDKLYQVKETLLADKTVALRETPHCKALHEAYDDMLAWLKSLRPQPKPEVNDEEIEEMVTKRSRSTGTTKSEMDFYRNGIKDAIKQFGLRPSWKPSEDEERLINTSISFLKDFADKGYENAVECIDWLKSKLNGNSGK